MAPIHDIFEKVLSHADPTVDRGMAAALPTADPSAARLLALSLLKRQHPEGAEVLILRYHKLSGDIQQAIVEHADELFTPIRLAAGRSGTAGPDNMLAIVGRAMATRLAYLVVELLRHGSEARRAMAGRCLRTMAARCRTDEDAAGGGAEAADKATEPAAAAYLCDAVAQAVAGYASHLDAEVLGAMADLLPRSMPAATRGLAHPRHAALPVLRTRLAAGDDPALRRASLYLLGLSTLSEDVIAGLSVAAGSEGGEDAEGEDAEHEAGRADLADRAKEGGEPRQTGEGFGQAMLGHAMLGLRATVEPLRRIAPDATPWPTIRQIQAMPVPQARGLPAWAAALPAPVANTTARLRSLAQVDDTLTRLAALRRLIDLSHAHDDTPAYPPYPHARRSGPHRRLGAATGVNSAAASSPQPPHALDTIRDAIAHFTHDPHPAVARIALWHLIRVRYARRHRVLVELVNAPDPRLRRIAGSRLGPIGFTRLWESWGRLGVAQRRAAGRAMLKIIPRFDEMLGNKLAIDDQRTRLKALSMVHDLALGDRLEPAVTELARGRDPKVASAAVKALDAGGYEATAPSVVPSSPEVVS